MTVKYTAFGGAAELWNHTGEEVLLDGPAGTGKSRVWGEILWRNMHRWPGCRQLVVRQTRVSLSESFLKTFEEIVVPPGHPILNGPMRSHRHYYEHPNGSRIVLGGMDNKTRLFSTEFDQVFVNEAIECVEDDWEALHRSLRNGIMPYQQLGGDTNPGARFHWLNQRCLRGLTHRIWSRHIDNPSITKEYLFKLARKLTGSTRKRLYEGLWCGDEGLVYENWDPAIHVVPFKIDPTYNEATGKFEVYDFRGLPRNHDGTLELVSYTGSIDFGYANPGTLQIWGHDRFGRMYLVAEVYRRGKNIEWWGDRLVHLYHRYKPVQVFCDHLPDQIEILNARISRSCNRHDMPAICVKADKSWEAGSDLVRTGLARAEDEIPRLFVCKGTLDCGDGGDDWGADPEMQEKGKPISLEQEIESLMFRKVEDGRDIKGAELQDPTCANHACDAMRYNAVGCWGTNFRPHEAPTIHKPGTYGEYWKVDEILAIPEWMAYEMRPNEEPEEFYARMELEEAWE